MSSTHIYATSSDMIDHCEEFEEKRAFLYAFGEHPKSPRVVICDTAKSIDRFWTSPSGVVGRTILLVPTGYDPKPREVELKAGGRNFLFDPTCVDKCVVLQEGGMFVEGSCLIAGRLTNAYTDDWSKSTFSALSRIAKKRFNRVKSYYLGSEAKKLFETGYRLTFQSSAPNISDLRQID